jgi:hypothetical protein
MTLMEYLIQGGLIFAILSFVYVTRKEMAETMGELKAHCKDREHITVRKEECYRAMNDVGFRMADLKDDIKTLRDDINSKMDMAIDLIKKNGKH